MKFLTANPKGLSICLLLFWGGIVYANTLDVPFYFDDVLNIVEPEAIQLRELSAAGLGKVLHESRLPTRPVANLSFALNHYFDGDDVAGYHLVNIAIHLLCGVVAYLVFLRTLALCAKGTDRGSARIVSLFAALLWLVHPVNTQTVTYVVQRMNGLAALFFLLSLYSYICGRRREKASERTGCLLLAFFCWLLALGSKETAIVLPVIILLYEWLFFQNKEMAWVKRNFPVITVLFVLVIVAAFCYTDFNPLGRVMAGYEQRSFSPVERLLTQSRVVVHYASLLYYPATSRLGLEHDFQVSTSVTDPLNTLLSLAVIAGLLVFALAKLKRHRLLLFGVLWFFINLALESSLVPLEIIFEHRTYLPYIFLIFGAVHFAFSATDSKTIVALFMSFMVLLFSFWTLQRNNEWREPVSFWEKAVAGAPRNARASNYLGMALSDTNRYGEAILSFRKAIQIRPLYYHAHNNLGVALLRKGLFGEAGNHLLIAAQGEGVRDEAFNNLGMAHAARGDLANALKYFSLALEINPSSPEINNNLGGIYAELGQLDQGSYYLNQALKKNPENADSHSNLGHIASRQGMPERALAHYRQALRIDPGHVNARRGLASLYRGNPGLRDQ